MLEEQLKPKCNCGCGRVAPLYTLSDKRIGAVAGQPVRFIRGHNSKNPRKKSIEGDKECRSCKAVLPRTKDYFFSDSSRPDGLANQCKKCHRASNDDYTKRNLQASKEYQRKYKLENNTRVAERIKHWREKNRDYARQQVKDWCNANPEKTLESSRRRRHRRRARLANVESKPINFKNIWEKYHGMCGICDQPIEFEKAHFDHIIPLAEAGPDTEENLQPAHLRCNSIKGTRSQEHARKRARELGVCD